MFKKLIHYLFKCPTFWSLKPFYTCPDCKKKYRCYWNGNDCFCGVINLCNKCNSKHEKDHPEYIIPCIADL